MSSAEAEYNSLAFGMQSIAHIRQLTLEINGLPADTPITVPVYCDSESAIAMGSSLKDTKRTRHIQRRVHFVREGFASKNFTPVKIEGELNPSDIGTKNVDPDTRDSHMHVLHVTTDP